MSFMQKLCSSAWQRPLIKEKTTLDDNLESVTKNNKWKAYSSILLQQESFSINFIESFHTKWTESGHRIREQINDDKLLVNLLRHVLPKYNDEGLTLYRGENSQRFNQKKIGLCWSKSKNIAVMFARGRNSSPEGGVLLKCTCNKNWIISSPGTHSKYLGESEYIIDPFLLKNINIEQSYA